MLLTFCICKESIYKSQKREMSNFPEIAPTQASSCTWNCYRLIYKWMNWWWLIFCRRGLLARLTVNFCMLFSLPLGRDDRWPRLANQVEVRQALFRPPFLGQSPCGASNAVPNEVCLVAQSAVECCCCLGSTDKRQMQLSRLHTELRLRLPVPSSTCRFRISSIAVRLFLSW